MANELRKLTDQLREFWAGQPPSRRGLLGLVLVIGVLGGAFAAFAPPVEHYAVLFAGLAPEDAAKVIEQLKAQNIPYRLQNNGTTLEVPSGKEHELRITMASSGLPKGGGVGFEVFDKQTFGTTSFVEQMNYRRALQGELARTIMSLDAVERARVMIALRERTLYRDEDEPPSASVVLQFRAGRQLAAAQVKGVVHLVSSSVEGLRTDRVTVVDDSGAVLWSGEEALGLGRQHDIERTLSRRVTEIIERVVGIGHAAVVVTAEIDHDRTEHLEETYDKDKIALRSETRMEERSGSGDATTSGVAGARGNLPGTAEPTTDSSEGGRSRLSETKNYEVNHVINKRINPNPRLKRLHVAVLVDGKPGPKGEKDAVPRSAEELARIESLAKEAAGLDAERGDRIEVKSVPFAPIKEPEPLPVEKPLLSFLPKWWPLAAAGAGLVFGIGFLFFVYRLFRGNPSGANPGVRSLVSHLPVTVGQFEAAVGHPGVSGGAALAGTIAAGGTPQLVGGRPIRDRVVETIRGDTTRSAKVLSNWLAETSPTSNEGSRP